VAVESTTQFVRWAIIGSENETNAEANVMFIANNTNNRDAVFVMIGTALPRQGLSILKARFEGLSQCDVCEV
jgi:hypothetical protein